MCSKPKTIVKNNFWILEENGTKVGTVNKEGKKYVVPQTMLDDPNTIIRRHCYPPLGEDCFKEPN